MKPILFFFTIVCALSKLLIAQADDDTLGTPNVGERLFLETRFSQYFFTNSGGNANFKLVAGDPVMDVTSSIHGPLPGTFAGQAMNCRACHFVEEHALVGNRTYADFATRSPIPNIGDKLLKTPRNSIDLVDSLLPHSTPLFLHYDGQFASVQDLIISTLAGRNFGWKPTEYATALAHIVHVIRTDDGRGGLAQQYGGWTYAEAFAGLEQIEPQYRIKSPYRLFDIKITNKAAHDYVSDERIIQDAAALIQAYMETLVFSQDTNGQFNGSPYDIFLIKNQLPQKPSNKETDLQYSRRLLRNINELSAPKFVTDPEDGQFSTRTQKFQFGPTELAGLRIFLADAKTTPRAGNEGKIGNCVACHSPPAFTDFLFHNTGVAQEEYDFIHGRGSFTNLNVPDLNTRQKSYNDFLPPTPNHPEATGIFITPPTLEEPRQIDLGLWNVFANPDFPAPQPGLLQILPQLLEPAQPLAKATINGHDFIISAENGPPGWTCHILTATDLNLPPAEWSVLSTNIFDDKGRISFSGGISPAVSAYYLLSLVGTTSERALPYTIALFKTPDLRDLGSSEPYFHTGNKNTIEDVIAFYQTTSSLARDRVLRNIAPEISGISLDSSAVVPLTSFLQSLNEDYLDVPCPCP